MQRQPPIADACSPAVPPQAVQVTVRNSRGDGSRRFVIDVAPSGTVADVKRLLCLPPHSVVSDASALELVLEGCILHDDDILVSAVVPEGLILTAVLIVFGSTLAPKQPQSVSAARLVSANRAAPCVSAPADIDVVLALPASATAAGESRGESTPSPSSTKKDATDPPLKGTHVRMSRPPNVPDSQSTALAAPTLRDGSRVRIVGLQVKPQHNERTGVVCGAFDQKTARWTVDVAANDAGPSFQIRVLAANLRLIASHNFSTEWVDEGGRVWPKNVDFSRQCAKGHALAPLGERGGLADNRLMCRLCHCFFRRSCVEATNWLMCSEDVGCCGEYAVCCSCARSSSASPAACADSDDFCTLGISVSYLSWLRSTVGWSLGRMTTSQFCQLYVRPFTWCSRGSVTERLMARGDTAEHVGEATWFISHTWSNAFADTLDAVLLFFEGREDAASAKVWMDVMVTSQHLSAGPSKPPSWWMGAFTQSIARIGGLLLVVDKWDNPTALSRAWCVLELHAIATKMEEKDGRFAITMTRNENVRFLTDIMQNNDGHKQYYSMIGRVNAETSECSRASDRESIHEGIRRSVGFAKLNRMLFTILEGWMVDQFKFQIEANEAAGNKRVALQWKALLGIVLTEQGRYDEARVIHEANLKTFEVAHKLWDPSEHAVAVAHEMANLANSLVYLGRYEDALALYKKVFDIYNRALPEDDPQISNAMNNLASCYGRLGRLQDALVMAEKTLEFRRRVLPENHPQIGRAIGILAGVYENLGRFHEAHDLQEQAVAFLQRVLPENHPDKCFQMIGLTKSYRHLGRHQDALVMAEKTFQLVRRALPENHPLIGEAMDTLAVAYSALGLGRHQDAVVMAEKALEFRRRVLPENHPHIADSMGTLTLAYSQIGRHQDALEMAEKDIQFRRRVLPENHPTIGAAMDCVAGMYLNLGRHQDALVMAEKALEFWRRVLPENHPQIGETMAIVATSFHELGRDQDALVLREKILEFDRHVLHKDDPHLGDAMVKLAQTYSLLQRHHDALTLKEEVLQHYRRVLPDNHPDIDQAMGNLANTYLDLGRLQEALVLHEKSLDFRRRVLPEGHPHTRLALINLGRSYRALGRYQDALAMREQELDFNRRFNSF